MGSHGNLNKNPILTQIHNLRFGARAVFRLEPRRGFFSDNLRSACIASWFFQKTVNDDG